MKNTNCKICNKELTRRQRIYCSNVCKLGDVDNIKLRTSKKQKQNDSKLIKCKVTGKIFKDIKNYSGILTKHLLTIGIKNDDIFSNFDIIDNPDKDKVKYHCKYCDWSTIDINNVSGCVTNHIIENHRITISEHIQRFDNESNIFEHNNKSNVRNKFFEENPNSFISCKICNKKFKKITNIHLKTHGITCEQYMKKFKLDNISSLDVIEKCKKIYLKNYDKINVANKCSNKERELHDFISSLGVSMLCNDRKIIHPLELDIYLPELKIGIEYNGLIWHSEFFGKKTMKYHLKKTEECEKKGIRLIHIFEDEWIYKKEIVKSKIINLLKLRQNSIYARKCVVKPIKNYIKNDFLDKYHIQGSDRSKIHLGLFYDNNLVSVMTFCKPRIIMGYKDSKEGSFELSRFASSTGVIGGASKLLRYFIANYYPNNIITFADRRWTSMLEDSMYEKIGFEKIKVNKPNYWYVINGRIRKHRYSYNKYVIVNKLGGNINLSEVENMKLLGYDRIWDCGTIKYEINLKQLNN